MADRDVWAKARLVLAAVLVVAGAVESVTGDALVGFVVLAVGCGAAAFDAVLVRLDRITGHTGGLCPSLLPLLEPPGAFAVCVHPYGHRGDHEDTGGIRWSAHAETTPPKGARRG